MEGYRIVLLSLLLGMVIVQCLASTDRCATEERANPGGKCRRTCNACRDCGECLCKSGYIRLNIGGPCVSEEYCHTMHFKWMKDAKYNNDNTNFFNCK
ncbi:chymotrypsin inhibitor Ani s 6-like [Macrosteles quadrilineatus]|uniref:chymotrypsin inhibitor Ani s 6-like n=1 Tax=Macrosteles quadrilineatus TaxID=74068 RepID=UPI0023E2AC7C|nr:chymotrypsin inhibitor Ani s 6-like [Macrosteles quadrilineatus]